MKKYIIKVPNHIQVGAHRYRILTTEQERLKDENLHGEANHRRQSIAINISRPPSQQEEVLIHECLHCADRIFNEGETPEKTIGGLSEGLTQIFHSMGVYFEIQKRRGKR